MADRIRAPRLKEQLKDNAVEVMRNQPAKAELRKEEAQNKAVEIREREENAETC